MKLYTWIPTRFLVPLTGTGTIEIQGAVIFSGILKLHSS